MKIQNTQFQVAASSSLEVQSIDSPCVIINKNVNNDMRQNKGNPQRDDPSVTGELQSKNPREYPYLIVNTNANFITTNNIDDKELDESLITSSCSQ